MVEGEGLSNLYIDKQLKSLKVDCYKGVFSSDTIPTSLLEGHHDAMVCCIVNTSEVAQVGTHFLTLALHGYRIDVIDSLALPLDAASPALSEALVQSGKKIRFRFKLPRQKLTSLFCGFHCILNVMLLCRDRFPNRAGLKRLRTGEGAENDERVCHNILALVVNNPSRN